MSAASPRISAHALFGPYCRREWVLADEQAVLEYSNWRRCLRLRARYDSPGMRELLLNLEAEIEGPSFSRIKHDRTTTVGTLSRDGRRYVVKRYNTKNPWHFVRRAMRRSRAHNGFDFARRLMDADVATAPPVAMVESRLGPLKGRSYLVSEYVEGPTCLQYVTEHAGQPEAAEIAARLERLFKGLARMRITHGDMKATNVILRENRFPVLIDLDAMRSHASESSYETAHEKDRQRFMKNWRDRSDLVLIFGRVDW